MVSRNVFIVGFGLYGSIHGSAEYQVNMQVRTLPSALIQNARTHSCHALVQNIHDLTGTLHTYLTWPPCSFSSFERTVYNSDGTPAIVQSGIKIAAFLKSFLSESD